MPNPIAYTGTFKTIRNITDWINSFEVSPELATGTLVATITINGESLQIFAPNGGGGGGSFFELGTYVDINGNTVEALYELDEAVGTDPNFEVDEYVDINGDTVLALYEKLEE